MEEPTLAIRIGTICVSRLDEYLPVLKEYVDRDELGKKHRLSLTIELHHDGVQYQARVKTKAPTPPVLAPEDIAFPLLDANGQLSLLPPPDPHEVARKAIAEQAPPPADDYIPGDNAEVDPEETSEDQPRGRRGNGIAIPE
jgi:hypothetical protein